MKQLLKHDTLRDSWRDPDRLSGEVSHDDPSPHTELNWYLAAEDQLSSALSISTLSLSQKVITSKGAPKR